MGAETDQFAHTAFTLPQTAKITKVSERQLVEWDRDKFFVPEYAGADRGEPYSRIYSFRDLVELRVIATLRNEFGISRQYLRKLHRWLREKHADRPWSQLKFWIVGKRVRFEDPQTGYPLDSEPFGQRVFPFDLAPIVADVQSNVVSVRTRTEEQVGHVATSNRHLAPGHGVIAGTRLTTDFIADLYESGRSVATIVADYPQLKEQDVRAAIEYEAKRKRRTA